MDSEDEASTCSICFDSFLLPKLLSCRHTFCKPCLQDYTKKVEVSEIKCPLCRQKQILDDRGLDGLMDNYFVPLRPPESPAIHYCEICYEEVLEISQCKHCVLKFCESCKSSHDLALKMSGELKDSDIESDGCDEDEESEEGGGISLSRLLHFSEHNSGTKLIVKFLSSFKVPYEASRSEEQMTVVNIFPKSENTCLVIYEQVPEMIECTIRGRPFVRKTFSEGIRGITKTREGKILFSNHKEAAIFQMVDESRIAVFAKCYTFRPLSISTFRDGRIACTGITKNDHQYLVKRSDAQGALQIFDDTGKSLNDLSKAGHEFSLRQPISISVNPQNDTVCIADIGSRQVLIMTDEGYLIRKYKGRSGDDRPFGLRLSTGLFLPSSLCHDPEGNLVVANLADGSLHLLLPNGDLCGFIETKNNSSFGNPNTLCFDHQNRLWVGDHQNGKIKIYQVMSFKNSFHHTAH